MTKRSTPILAWIIAGFCAAIFATLILTLRAAQDIRKSAKEMKEAILTVNEEASGISGINATDQRFDSPRLLALSKELDAGKSSAVQVFWQEMAGKAPLVEPVGGDRQSNWVTYLWRGGPGTRRVCVMGGPWPEDSSTKWLAHLGGTDIWYRTERLPSDSRFVYSFHVNGPLRWPMDTASWLAIVKENPLQADPLNLRAVESPPRGSIAELPGASPQPWVQRSPQVVAGALNERTIKSEILRGSGLGKNAERTCLIYLPPHYDPQKADYGLLLLFDGRGFMGRDMPIPVMLDNLIAEGKIPPLVVIFVYQSDQRFQELSCSQPFADFLAKELVPWVRSNYHVSTKPERTIVGGVSAGGLMAAYCGFCHPEVFGNVLSVSGSFPWYPGYWESSTTSLDAEPGWLTRQFLAEPHRSVRFYLSAGRFENSPGFSLLGENRHLRDVLLAKDYSVAYHEFDGGHDVLSWRGPLVEGLEKLTRVLK